MKNLFLSILCSIFVFAACSSAPCKKIALTDDWKNFPLQLIQEGTVCISEPNKLMFHLSGDPSKRVEKIISEMEAAGWQKAQPWSIENERNILSFMKGAKVVTIEVYKFSGTGVLIKR